jgi:hypothetical protein
MRVQKGNPYICQVLFTDKTGQPYNLTGKTVFFTVKKINDFADNDDAALIKKDITTHADASGGITTISLTAVDTNMPMVEYKADLRVYEAGVIQANTLPFAFTVSDIVTKRIS